mmetsp:Transcript_3254/g.4694  ORF Transcript_3254/g.4694 Transcript_3254/m.4694 type:complete len:245 (+) Transcript_3254:73-807(+)|eukprot:CAMPEP_0203749080 /NCGR_PEP_ID=MMETSP0098-20131031/3767_1 /ASSEMBLY_ACC=CAM_ASM_000208 /TAXON_ID=96639 /ORGANISM=" , Strain NY0313808BC1" /LENGTH=244 /DNA_ID=CAMNT_0050638025 /DNA_START=489 /DNA_END=1223 /DNA_ORIENTATION=-
MIACVSGGSRGIGLAIASSLLRSGNLSALAVLGRSNAALENAVQVLKGQRDGVDLLGVTCDVSKSEQVEKAMREINDKMGHVDVLVNAAGITKDGLLVRQRDAHIEEVIGTNLIGTMYLTRAVVKGMLKSKTTCGSILSVGSVVGSHGNVGQSVYSASKSGLIGFTKSLAKELGPRKIRVNLLEPGFIQTDMTASLDEDSLAPQIPLGRFGQVNEVASLANFILTHKDASYITGQTFRVDGGMF